MRTSLKSFTAVGMRGALPIALVPLLVLGVSLPASAQMKEGPLQALIPLTALSKLRKSGKTGFCSPLTKTAQTSPTGLPITRHFIVLRLGITRMVWAKTTAIAWGPTLREIKSSLTFLTRSTRSALRT